MELGENGSRNKWKPANVENPIFMMHTHVDYVDLLIFKPLQTKYFPYKDYLRAYQYIDENRTMKVIIFGLKYIFNI